MSSDERIEQLELEVKVLRANNKGLKDKIDEQSKEIEELKENNKFLNWYFENQKDNFVHKDKIKAKIEEYEEKIKKIKEKDVWEEPYDSEKYVRYTNYIYVLQSLLEKE